MATAMHPSAVWSAADDRGCASLSRRTTVALEIGTDSQDNLKLDTWVLGLVSNQVLKWYSEVFRPENSNS